VILDCPDLCYCFADKAELLNLLTAMSGEFVSLIDPENLSKGISMIINDSIISSHCSFLSSEQPSTSYSVSIAATEYFTELVISDSK
jgi:hypothetical protein